MTPRTREQLPTASEIREREHFRKQYVEQLLEAKLLEMTIPDKPLLQAEENLVARYPNQIAPCLATIGTIFTPTALHTKAQGRSLAIYPGSRC